MILQFEKMHGLGNDFILCDLNQFSLSNIDNISLYNVIDKKILQQLANRKLGIGCDQLIFYEKKTDGINILIYNADGEFAEMCGNAFRCIGLLMYKKHQSQKTTITSNARKYQVNFIEKHTDDIGIFSAEMGTQQENLQSANIINNVKIILTQNNIDFSYVDFVNLANKHLIVFLNEFLSKNIINTIAIIINKTIANLNISFAKIMNNNQIDITVFERGTGLTDACGSAASAVAFSANKNNFIENSQIQIKQIGGILQIKIDSNNIITQTGIANYVFSGEILI